jgi:hypothetical protein
MVEINGNTYVLKGVKFGYLSGKVKFGYVLRKNGS